MLRDLRFGWRMLLKQPGFSLIAILTLMLGIGATSAVFSLVEGVLLTPPPYRQPERIVLIPAARSDHQPSADPRGWPAAQWMDWARQSKSFESIAGYNWAFNYLVLANGSESMEGMWVTHDYFRVLGLKPLIGRTFSASETGPNPAPVIILGYDLWQRKFNGDPHILGRKIHISRSDTPPTVIGIMPPGVRFLPSPGASREPNYNVNAQVDFWIPAGPIPGIIKAPIWDVAGRLRHGVSLTSAQGELQVMAARQAHADRDFEGFTPELHSLPAEMNRDGRRILLPLFGAAALVLLIACGNAAALLLVRGLQRQQEYAVRSALGAGRTVLFRQVASESLLVALTGGACGIALALGVVRVFKAIGGHAIPRLDAVTTAWPVLAGAFGSAIAAALVAGLLPAMRAARLDPIEALKSAGPRTSAGRGERRLLRLVTMAQTALTLALLVGAGLLIRTMMNISKVPSGYRISRILTMSVTAVQGDWNAFHRTALERVAALPGVEYAAFAWGVPLTGNNWPGTVDIEGQPEPSKASDRIAVPLRSVTQDYFKLIGLPILAGRGVRATDIGDRPNVAVVNRAFVDRYFPRTAAVGKKLWFGSRKDPPIYIVGVVANSRTADLTQAAEPEIYFSLWQARAFSKHLVVRTTEDPRFLTAAIVRALRSVDATASVENVKTMEQIRDDSLASRTFAMQLLVGFSLVGSVLTLVGIYGVLSLSVASRRRELAVRAAIGAQERDLRNLVFAEGFRLIAGGLIAGIAAALLLSGVLRAFLFDVQPADPMTLIAVALLFAAVALLACWAPTRRAARIDPAEALHYE